MAKLYRAYVCVCLRVGHRNKKRRDDSGNDLGISNSKTKAEPASTSNSTKTEPVSTSNSNSTKTEPVSIYQ